MAKKVEVLWSNGVRKLPPLSTLLVKGRNLYKEKTYRQMGEMKLIQLNEKPKLALCTKLQ